MHSVLRILRTSIIILYGKEDCWQENYAVLFNFGNPSWAMMALLGNSYSMRGYYEGRYRDKHK